MPKADPFPLPPSRFGELIVAWNVPAGAGFAGWELLPGMRFGEREAWWRGGCDRGGAHEGLDLCGYRTGGGARARLGAGARVPAAYSGEVVSVVGDFLGSSVFVAHGWRDGRGRRLHTVCGHVDPRPGLAPGSRVEAGECLGAIAAPRGGSAAPPHLHLTLALVAAGVGLLDWGVLGDTGRAVLLDPLPLIGGEKGTDVFSDERS